MECRLRAIFVNYRRQDTEGESGHLFDDLVAQFGERSVFMDVAAIEVGRDFRKAIDESIAGCGVLLAMIGPAWLDAANDGGERRLDDPSDFVRMEIASALKRDIPVIPVMVRGAKMPRPNQLPDDLRDLAYRNCVELTHVRWKSDVQVLVGALRSLVAESADSRLPAVPSDIARPVTAISASLVDAVVAVPSRSAPTSQLDSIVADAGTSTLSSDDISRVTRELSRYIGPIAEIVVSRAAQRCSSIVELRRIVADEIDASADRTRFLDAAGSP